MVNVSLIEEKQLGLLAGMYMRTTFVFKCEPEKEDLRKQRKICKWIGKLYMEEIQDFPNNIKELFVKSDYAGELLMFLKECQEEIKARGSKIKRVFEESTADISEDVKSALWEMLQQSYWSSAEWKGEDLEIIVEDNPSFRRTVVLKDADAVPDNIESFILDNLGLTLNLGKMRYCIYGEIEDVIEDSITPFEMTFSNAEVKVQVYNSIESVTFWDNPWDYLRTISFGIGQKSYLPGDYCNAKEKELLPLIKEIVKLEYWMELPEVECVSFTELKALTEKYGHGKITELLSQTEHQKPGSNTYNRNVKRIIALLCNKRCETLWRDIFEKLKESQKEYPYKVEMCCSTELLNETRMNIQKLMERHGYSGTYPDFAKKGSVRGIKLEQSYDMSYFIGMEKRAMYRIHCLESLEEPGYFTVQFLCGTAFLKKNEQVEDIYSCLFNAKGRRLYHLMHYYVKLFDDSDVKEDDLETSVTIAVKKTECIKLTRKEKKEYYGNTMPGIGMFLFWLIFGGGFFGILSNALMILVGIIMLVIFGEYREIPSLFTELPWGRFMLFSGIAFGEIMGLIEVLAKRK